MEMSVTVGRITAAPAVESRSIVISARPPNGSEAIPLQTDVTTRRMHRLRHPVSAESGQKKNIAMKKFTLTLAALAFAALPFTSFADHKSSKECLACCKSADKCDACCHDKGKGKECKECCMKKK